MSRQKQLTVLLLFTFLFTSCNKATATSTPYPVYNPFAPVNGSSAVPAPVDGSTAVQAPVQAVQIASPTRLPSGPTPTRAPLSVTIPHRNPTQFLFAPTPDSPHPLPTPR